VGYASACQRLRSSRANVFSIMRCAFCNHGETQPTKVTVTLQRRETTVILKGVPADVCENCGEYYLSEAVTAQVLQRAEEAVRNGAEIEILRFAA
jgi:YgiT-type zinc finger domain-containing protein